MAWPIDFSKQVFHGKTIYRILFNDQVKKHCALLSGRVIDLAGGSKSSYYPYLPAGLEITKTNYFAGEGIDQVVNLDQVLPFADDSFDAALLFNAIYIMAEPAKTLAEIKRILKPGGKLYLASPFIANEMPEPHDYCRFTAEGLEQLLAQAGFSEVKVERFGERFSSAAYLLHLLFGFNLARFLAYSAALFLDKMIPTKLAKNYPTPLGYFCVVKK